MGSFGNGLGEEGWFNLNWKDKIDGMTLLSIYL
jgi:hypothetical protein